MPAGTDPPDLGMPQALFNTLHGFTYNATAKTFVNAAGVQQFLYAQKKTGGSYDQGEWFYGTASEGGSNPKALVPQLTYDVIHNGTYNTSDATVTYTSQKYRFRLKVDASGAQVAEAHIV
jgi:hypothetical protein